MVEALTHNHWWWRPGWRPGRSFYTWHVTFSADSPVSNLVDLFAPALSEIPTMDPVAREGLHITLQGVGFSDEVAESDLEQIYKAAAQRLAECSPFDAVIGPPSVDEETIGMPIVASEGFQRVRQAIQGGIADVWGIENVPERNTELRPHLTLAYSSGPAPIYEMARRLARRSLDRIEVVERVASISLIELNRDNGRYEWTEVASAALGRSLGHVV